MKKILLCAGVLGLVFGVAVAEPERAEKEELEILGHNIKLEFKMVPLEEEDKGVFLVTASSWYQTGTHFEGEDARVAFEISGHIRILDEDKWFVTYEAHVEYNGEHGEAAFHVDSSTLLTPGKAYEVARMGDKTLVIRGSLVDEE